MAARHYNIEISTDDGASWSLARGNETPGPGKSLVVSGLAAGSYLVRLRLIALSGDPTPVVSDQVLLQVGPVISDELLSTAEAVTTVADLLVLQEQLLSSAGVEVSAETLQVMAEQVVAAAQGAATVSDALVYAEQLVAAVEAQASAADLQAMAEQLVTAVAVEVGVVDVQTGVVVEAVESAADVQATVLDSAAIAEQLVAAVEVQASAADVQAMAEQLVAAAAGVALVADGAVRSEAVASAGDVVATAAALQIMLEGVAAAVTAQATAADGAIRRDAAVAAAEVVASVADVFVPGVTAPGQVTGLTAETGPPGQVALNWAQTATAESYDVYWRQGAAPTTSGYDGVINGVTEAQRAAGDYPINGPLVGGEVYYFAVRAANAAGAGTLSAAAAAAAAAPVTLGFEAGMLDSAGRTWLIQINEGGTEGPDEGYGTGAAVAVDPHDAGNQALMVDVTQSYDDPEAAYFSDSLYVRSSDGSAPYSSIPAGATVTFRYKCPANMYFEFITSGSLSAITKDDTWRTAVWTSLGHVNSDIIIRFFTADGGPSHSVVAFIDDIELLGVVE